MVNPILIGSVLGSTVAYLKKIGKIPYTLEEALEILMGHPIGDDVTWEDNENNLGDEVTWNAAPQQTKVKFPRAKADKIVKKVEKHLKPYVVDMMACGSYRRGAQMIGDIDFVLILKPGYELPEVLPANEGINWVGNKKAQVIIDGEKVDFRVTTPDAWGATILYFTGPADFNIKYRWMAKKKGLKLSEYGLFDRNTGKYIAGKTENDIFTALGRPYKNPDVRKGFRAEYQPNQSLEDYSHQDLMTSSVVTGDFTTDSLKYGFGPTALSAEERFYYHGTDARSLASILEEGIKPTGVEDSVWNEELEDVSPHPYYYEEVDDFLPSVFVAETPEEAQWWAEEAGNTEIVVLKISSQVENLANFSDDGVGGWRTSETIPTNYIVDILSSETFEAEDNYEATYGKEQAKIRRRLKNKIMKQAIMGTKAGQWSARKSQELKRQYEDACNKKGLRAYKGKKTQKQQNLTDWSQQKWGTASGKKSSKTGEPYFPAKAIEALKDRGLYAKAKRQKAAATKAGKQHARYSDDIREVVKPFRAESFVTLDIKDMDRFLRNRRFKPVDIVYRNRPVKEWVYERALPGRPNHVVRVYTSINRYGHQKGRGRDVGRDAIRVQVVYQDNQGETLVSAPTRVHRIGTWETNLDKRLLAIATEKPQVVFDSRGEPMTLRKHKGKLFWGSRDYPNYKETRPFSAEEDQSSVKIQEDAPEGWTVITVADWDNNFYKAYQMVIEVQDYNQAWSIVEMIDDVNLLLNKVAETKFRENRVVITVYTSGEGITSKDDYWCEEFNEVLETL